MSADVQGLASVEYRCCHRYNCKSNIYIMLNGMLIRIDSAI